jgi:heme/copper-type cytochrome/quinol oxidase subunit 4
MVVLLGSLAPLAIAMGAITTLIAVTLALGLLHKKDWARILVLIFAIIQVAAQLLRIGMATASRAPLTMVGEGIWLVIWAVATTYLLQPQIKSVFASH